MVAPPAPAGVDLTMDELREVTRYVAESAAFVQDVFQRAHPQDPRVGAAIDAAQAFAGGGLRSRRLRTASIDAHRAAKDASSEAARLAARAAGDAAAAAYLHPIARAHQVGHILRAAACAARIAELNADDDPTAAARVIEDATVRGTPVLVDVLSRYPTPPAGRNRVEQFTSALDTSAASPPRPGPGLTRERPTCRRTPRAQPSGPHADRRRPRQRGVLADDPAEGARPPLHHGPPRRHPER